MARRRLPLSDSEKAKLLAQLKVCREACVDVRRVAPIAGAEYEAAHVVMAAIDDFAGVLTGNRQHFWIQPARSREPCARCAGEGWLCEAHPTTPHPHDGCAGPGEPCPACNAGDPPRPPVGFVSLVRGNT